MGTDYRSHAGFLLVLMLILVLVNLDIAALITHRLDSVSPHQV